MEMNTSQLQLCQIDSFDASNQQQQMPVRKQRRRGGGSVPEIQQRYRLRTGSPLPAAHALSPVLLAFLASSLLQFVLLSAQHVVQGDQGNSIGEAAERDRAGGMSVDALGNCIQVLNCGVCTCSRSCSCSVHFANDFSFSMRMISLSMSLSSLLSLSRKSVDPSSPCPVSPKCCVGSSISDCISAAVMRSAAGGRTSNEFRQFLSRQLQLKLKDR